MLHGAWLLVLAVLPGCAAFVNPIANGIPVERLPREILGDSREKEQTIPEIYLKAPKQDPYLISPNDVLGVFIKNVTGGDRDIPPVMVSPDGRNPPSVGFPFAVREDGTVSLPLAPAPIKVLGLSVTEAEALIKKKYVEEWGILRPENANIIVTMQRQHTNNVLVLRQDQGGVQFSSGGLSNTKRGTGIPLDLQYNESDVATALTRSGGLPGLDAKNEVIIFRGAAKGLKNAEQLVMPDIKNLPSGKTVLTRDPQGNPALEVVRIPLRLRPGQNVPFHPEDVRLGDGDVVFIETRETELFYVGGLLPPGEFVLPRDYDLDVVEAIAQVRGAFFNGGVNVGGFQGSVTGQGLGSPSPTNLTVIRRWPEGKQVLIHVDLAKALRDPRERINVKPGDILFLQETYGEAFTRYFTQSFALTYFSDILRTSTSSITFTGRSP
jgi:protein involved in polysaccharide export with SLBB domain